MAAPPQVLAWASATLNCFCTVSDSKVAVLDREGVSAACSIVMVSWCHDQNSGTRLFRAIYFSIGTMCLY